MKRSILILAIVLTMTSALFAQTARDNFDTVLTMALSNRSDLQLYYVTAGGSVDPNGSNTSWLYFFAVNQSIDYQFTIVAGNNNRFEVFPDFNNWYLLQLPIPFNFRNSDGVMRTADANGGADYRASHSGCRVKMSCGTFGTYSPDPDRLLWLISYYVNRPGRVDSTLMINIDLLTGQFLSSTNARDVNLAMLPESVVLNQNYPNPFNPTTTISFSLPSVSNVSMDVIDRMGRKVTSLVEGRMTAGTHNLNFDGSRFSSGEYIYRLNVNGKVYVQRMTLVK